MTLTAEQTAALNAIIDFINSDCCVFILKGYAGTGKTTLLKHLLKILSKDDQKRQVSLFASTGRAAKILQEKTGDGSTIHSGIYFKKSDGIKYKNNENLELTVDADSNNKLIFGIKLDCVNSRPIVIVDESSMISSKTAPEDQFQFGTDNLLDDLLTFSGITNGGQLIFIGDDAQLPPVTNKESAALSTEFFTKRHISVRTASLKKVMRQGTGSVILENAMAVRDNIFKEKKDRFGFNYKRMDGEFSDITPSEAIIETARNFKNTIVITYANATATNYNNAIRQVRFPGHSEPVPGDRLLVVKNAYVLGASDNTCVFNMFNGEFCDILEVGEEEIKYAFVGPKRIGLKFRNVQIRHESGAILKLKIITNLLDSSSPNLTTEESKALFSEFTSRHPHLLKKEYRAQFLKELHHDPYFNAIQVKYGYAITCHKAQGGEWDNVIVDFTGRSGNSTESLRWTYTALTRARKHLMLVNLVHSTPFSKMTIHSISKLKAMDADCHAKEDANIPVQTPFHDASTPEYKRAKYAAVERLLLPIETITEVISKEWQEIYKIKIGQSVFRYDTSHNKKGVFNPFSLMTNPSTAEATDLLLRLNTPQKPECRYSYSAPSTALECLDEIVKECASQANLIITNVVNHPSQSFVNYYFFSASYYKVQFYYKGNGNITAAMPSTIGEINDRDFCNFLQLLKDCCCPTDNTTNFES